MLCRQCGNQTRKFGRDRNQNQRYQCPACRITFSNRPANPLGEMRLPINKAVQVVSLLMEGCSVRSTERLSGVHRDTICNLLTIAGDTAKDVLESRIVNAPVKDVEIDEIWGFVGMKEKTRLRDYALSDDVGDAWCFIGFEANTKLILSWHLGKRTPIDVECFLEKLRCTVADGFQLTSDGFKPYPQAIWSVFGQTVSYAQLIKNYGQSDDDRRYSPPQIVSIDKIARIGNPDIDRVCTSYVERNNLSVRTFVRRMTRLTIGFSKKWENHEAALSLFFAYFNFCRKHSTLRTTPAIAAGLTDHVWSVEDLLRAGQEQAQ
jgi:transposase-like protein/IS1 family transposase